MDLTADKTHNAASLDGKARSQMHARPRLEAGRVAARLHARFRSDESGATAIEYALMATFFSITVIGGSSSIRNALQTAFSTVTSAIQAASNG